ncbi:transposase [Ralstonia pseudosolanacearum]|uniref:Transposase n=1 Tax=Ralstonia pseudosolanacearum TaxID=1310165 RepID=A0A454TK73_9RALS|nr:hypothetical protein RSOE_02805 [Ralstonia solanacearum OE1-1]RAA06950.1 hypothetical protein DOT67_21960 [Ralstonia pseudosolanacearum]RAA12740.1 hypothetical protein DOT79_18670 [Ralstonia pseudosolanacearum]RNM02151.1 hypothetical protein EGA29_22530 [Ralstonia pseudosolanacearum]TXD99901.1 transposase [Ralstonia pseudosolanacearum]
MTDVERAVVQPLQPHAAERGRRRACDSREAVNALRYPVQPGCC